MQQNATFLSPEEVYTKDVALYKQLFPAFDLFRYCLSFVALLLAIYKSQLLNEFVSSFIIIYSVRRSRPSLFMSLSLTPDM